MNKKVTLLSYCIVLLLTSTLLSAQNADYTFKTYTYAEDDSTKLELDLFLPDDAPSAAPLMIFLHGGGFSGGHRTHGHEFCQYMADNGIPAATISYTLYMKGKNFSCGGTHPEKVKAIQLGAYHAHLATNWLINRSEKMGIDTNKIFIAGSSAGAEAVLQAAFWDTSAVNFFPDTLSPSFKYAGLVSGAGAMLDIKMINDATKIPTLCFHGTCDPLVPYHMAAHHFCNPVDPGYLMLFGGLAIYERLTDLNGSVQLMSYCGDGHKHAGTPFYGSEKATVLEFIYRTLNGEMLNIHRIFKNGDVCELSQDFDFCD